jgi:hypothetical protein
MHECLHTGRPQWQCKHDTCTSTIDNASAAGADGAADAETIPAPAFAAAAAAAQVLYGSYPIAHCRDPYAVVRYMAERLHPRLQHVLQLRQVQDDDDVAAGGAAHKGADAADAEGVPGPPGKMQARGHYRHCHLAILYTLQLYVQLQHVFLWRAGLTVAPAAPQYYGLSAPPDTHCPALACLQPSWVAQTPMAGRPWGWWTRWQHATTGARGVAAAWTRTALPIGCCARRWLASRAWRWPSCRRQRQHSSS